jgi:hypothetical protein
LLKQKGSGVLRDSGISIDFKDESAKHELPRGSKTDKLSNVIISRDWQPEKQNFPRNSTPFGMSIERKLLCEKHSSQMQFRIEPGSNRPNSNAEFEKHDFPRTETVIGMTIERNDDDANKEFPFSCSFDFDSMTNDINDEQNAKEKS